MLSLVPDSLLLIAELYKEISIKNKFLNNGMPKKHFKLCTSCLNFIQIMISKYFLANILELIFMLRQNTVCRLNCPLKLTAAGLDFCSLTEESCGVKMT